MSRVHPPTGVHNDGGIPLLPVSSVRSVITLNSPPSCLSSRRSLEPSLSSWGNHGRHRRRGLLMDYITVNEPTSIAMDTYYKEKATVGGCQLERVTVVATCMPPRDGVICYDGSRSGRISLAAIVDRPSDERRSCRVIGVKYSPSKSSFSTVCIATVYGNDYPRTHTILLAIDTSGILQSGEFNFDDGNHLVNMQECQFEIDRFPLRRSSPLRREKSEDSSDAARGKSMDSPRKSPQKHRTSESFSPDDYAKYDEARAISEAIPASIIDRKEGGKMRTRLKKTRGRDAGGSIMSSASEVVRSSSLEKIERVPGKCGDWPDLSTMNTLNARLELKPSVTAIGPILSCSPDHTTMSPASSPNRSGRKRKHSPALSKTEDATTSQQLFLVASSLNGSLLPSESPPIVMLISSSIRDSRTCHLTGQAWATVPGLEHIDVPMTCILFASRLKCGTKIWDGIASTMRTSTYAKAMSSVHVQQSECNEGVVLMGFQDGTLRASVVATKRGYASSTVTLDIGKATTLLHLSSNEPLISIQLLPASLSFESATTFSQSPFLVCVGALGTVITLASPSESPDEKRHGSTATFSSHFTLESHGGFWRSVACIGYCLDEEGEINGLSFVGVNDSGRVFLHNLLILRSQSGGEIHGRTGQKIRCEQGIFCLPIPAGMASSIYAFPEQLFATTNPSGTHVTFTISSPNGKTTVMRYANQPLPSRQNSLYCGSIFSILSALRVEKSTYRQLYADEITPPREKSKLGPTKLQSLLRKLELASAKQNNSARQHIGSISGQFERALMEIRDVTRIAAYLRDSSSNHSSSPIQLKAISLKNGILDCEVTCRQLQTTTQSATTWIPSIHILQSCMHRLSPMLRPQSTIGMPPLCYRRTSSRDRKPTKVVYGGTATSYNGCDFDVDFGSTMMIFIPMNDLMPASIFGSMSIVYADRVGNSVKLIHDNAWYRSEAIADASKDDRRRRSHHSVLHSIGYASARRSQGSECYNILGVSLPFAVVRSSCNATLDILTHFSTSDGDHSAWTSEGVSREVAEKHVLRWYQNQSSRARLQHAYLFPRLQEQQLIRRHHGSNAGDAECAKVNCCSSSVRCTGIECAFSRLSSGLKTYCINIGFGPMAIVLRIPNEAESETSTEKEVCVVAFAVGSSIITPNESLSLLPLIRQAIIRRGLEQYYRNRASKTSRDYVSLLEAYHELLNGKQTKKITKRIQRSSQELLANIERTPVNACLTLYEILRTLNISFEF